MINLIEKFWDSEVRQMLTLATGIYFDYYLSAIGIDEQPPVPKNRKEINTHKTQDGHFCSSFFTSRYEDAKDEWKKQREVMVM